MWTRVAHVTPDFKIRRNTTSQFVPNPINKSPHSIVSISTRPQSLASVEFVLTRAPTAKAPIEQHFGGSFHEQKTRPQCQEVRLAVPQPAGCPNTPAEATTFGSRVELILVFSWFTRPSVAYIDGNHPAAAQGGHERRTKMTLAPRALEASNLFKICQRPRKGHQLRLSSVLR
jgi:hypothetical protein